MGDPVAAVAEHEATGEVAAIFADIRTTLGIPVVNLIWRHLATIDGGLDWAWQSAKPIYQSGHAERSADGLIARLPVPMPPALAPGALASAGVGDTDLATVRAIAAAYNRGNGLNLLALGALVTPPAGPMPAAAPVVGGDVAASIPRVLSQPDVAPHVWTLVTSLNRLGGRPNEPILATLYRHLAYWPGLLAVMHTGFRAAGCRRTIGAGHRPDPDDGARGGRAGWPICVRMGDRRRFRLSPRSRSLPSTSSPGWCRSASRSRAGSMAINRRLTMHRENRQSTPPTDPSSGPAISLARARSRSRSVLSSRSVLLGEAVQQQCLAGLREGNDLAVDLPAGGRHRHRRPAAVGGIGAARRVARLLQSGDRPADLDLVHRRPPGDFGGCLRPEASEHGEHAPIPES